MFGFVLLAVLFFVPGFLILSALNYRPLLKKVAIAPLLSMCIVGIAAYYLSFITPVGFWFVPLAAATSLIALLLMTAMGKVDARPCLRVPILGIGIAQISVLVFIGLGFAWALSVPSMAYDDFSYHIPLINAFVENGTMPLYAEPSNEFEIVANGFPHLFEVVAAIGKMTLGFDVLLIPLVVYAVAALLIALTLKEFGFGGWWGALFFASAILVFYGGVSFYVDVFLSACLLAAALFIIEYQKNARASAAVLSGFFMGAMVLVKFSAVIFVVPLLALVFWKFRDYRWIAIAGSAALLTGVVFYVRNVLLFGSPLYGLYEMQDTAFAMSTLADLFTDLLGTVFYTIREFVISNFLLIVLIFSALAFAGYAINRQRETWLVARVPIFVFVSSIVLIALSNPVSAMYEHTARFLMPAYALMCLSAGVYAESTLKRVDARMIVVAFMVLASILASLNVVGSTLLFYASNMEQVKEGSWYAKIVQSVPNSQDTAVFFANTFNPIILGLEKTEVRDHTSYTSMDTNSCRFLDAHDIDYVVFFRLNEIIAEFDRNGFLSDLKQAVDSERCGEILYERGRWILIYKVA